jgi:hypothetical protein
MRELLIKSYITEADQPKFILDVKYLTNRGCKKPEQIILMIVYLLLQIIINMDLIITKIGPSPPPLFLG